MEILDSGDLNFSRCGPEPLNLVGHHINAEQDPYFQTIRTGMFYGLRVW